jgi:hypothetical protein
MAAQPIGYDVCGMKTITLLGLAGIAFVSLSQPTWAGPRGGGRGFAGGGHVGDGGRVGALLVAAPAPRQPFTVVAFEEHRLSVAMVHTLPAEVSAD